MQSQVESRLRGGLIVLIAVLCTPGPAWPQGTPLGPEFQINTYTTGWQRGASVASDASGNFVVVWASYEQGDSEDGVFAQRYSDSGAPLGGEFHVNTYTTGYQRSGQVASDPVGNFVVVWNSQGQDGSEVGVFGQRYERSGAALGAEFRVNTYTTGFQFLGSAAVDAAGTVYVVWHGPGDGSFDGVFGQRYASSGIPLGGEFRVNTYTTGSQSSPEVATDPSGNFIVVWGGDDGSFSGLFGQRFASSGAPLGPEFRVNTETSGLQWSPAVAVEPSGSFVVVWNTYLMGVFGQRYSSTGTPVGTEFQVAAYTTSYQLGAFVGADSSGDFVVVWSDTALDGSGSGIFGRRYSNSGAELGGEFRVNTYTTNGQVGGSVAVDGSGRFVIVWMSDTQDGSFYGIFGQRYAQMVPVELMQFRVE